MKGVVINGGEGDYFSKFSLTPSNLIDELELLPLSVFPDN